jgi:hypothetical protein
MSLFGTMNRTSDYTTNREQRLCSIMIIDCQSYLAEYPEVEGDTKPP